MANKKIVLNLLVLLFLVCSSFTFHQQNDTPQIKWMTMGEAVLAHQKQPKKMIFDVYTDWCHWCKKMDATTFKNPEIIRLINENFYPVKFNAESKEKISVNGKTYGPVENGRTRTTHQFAIEMLQGRMSYPSYVIYDESLNNIGIVSGFKSDKDLVPILDYFSSDAYKNQSWENYSINYKNKTK